MPPRRQVLCVLILEKDLGDRTMKTNLRLAPAGLALALVMAPAADNYYGASNHIVIATPIGGDALVAGRVIEINERVGGDVLAAGWRVSLVKPAADDVRVAGAEVFINAPIEGDLTLAGGDVTLGSESRVTGRVWLSGGTVRANGFFNRDLHIAGGTVIIDGEVREGVTVIAETLEIRPTAKLLGPLTYRAPREAQVGQGAAIEGPVSYTKIEAEEAKRARSTAGFSNVLFAINVFLAGLLFFFILPRVGEAGVATLRAQPGHSLLLGFALLVTIPVAALLLVITIFGAPIGVSLVALYLVALLLGLLTAAYCIGELEARWLHRPVVTTRGGRAAVLVAGVLTLAILRAVIGGLAIVVAIVFGLGALALWTYRTYWSPRVAPAV
jgi:cytoskeletal protein CcmA (bactofilin family)